MALGTKDSTTVVYVGAIALVLGLAVGIYIGRQGAPTKMGADGSKSGANKKETDEYKKMMKK